MRGVAFLGLGQSEQDLALLAGAPRGEFPVHLGLLPFVGQAAPPPAHRAGTGRDVILHAPSLAAADHRHQSAPVRPAGRIVPGQRDRGVDPRTAGPYRRADLASAAPAAGRQEPPCASRPCSPG
ncbi:hypothetical protein GCM10025787_31590 [Saccharopolyspora rosea]